MDISREGRESAEPGILMSETRKPICRPERMTDKKQSRRGRHEVLK